MLTTGEAASKSSVAGWSVNCFGVASARGDAFFRCQCQEKEEKPGCGLKLLSAKARDALRPAVGRLFETLRLPIEQGQSSESIQEVAGCLLGIRSSCQQNKWIYYETQNLNRAILSRFSFVCSHLALELFINFVPMAQFGLLFLSKMTAMCVRQNQT